MEKLNIEALAERLKQHRTGVGVREAAREIGISPATLSRVENAKIPDLETFGKICNWLGDDPAVYLGLVQPGTPVSLAQVHFKKSHAIEPDTAEALGKMILLAHRALIRDEEILQG
jgi:transcriptional regulator with XRE-family HTH domain